MRNKPERPDLGTGTAAEVPDVGGGDRRFDRRHDVDAIRTITLGLLILYHAMISFQWVAPFIGFPKGEVIGWLGPLLAVLNVWRIPILFVVSGMAARFAIERRSAWDLLWDRTRRILFPFVAMTAAIAGLAILARAAGLAEENLPPAGHLWFLVNIFLYVLVGLPVWAWIRSRPGNIVSRGVGRLVHSPVGVLVLGLPLVVEAALVRPENYAFYANTVHGLVLGAVCFTLGFLAIDAGDAFWSAATRLRGPALAAALVLYASRQAGDGGPPSLLAAETWMWIVAIFGFGARHLNRPSAVLGYLSPAVYPVYIVHMPVQFALSAVILDSPLPAVGQLIALTAATIGASLLIYEAVRRVRWLRPFFGLATAAGAQPIPPPPPATTSDPLTPDALHPTAPESKVD